MSAYLAPEPGNLLVAWQSSTLICLWETRYVWPNPATASWRVVQKPTPVLCVTAAVRVWRLHGPTLFIAEPFTRTRPITACRDSCKVKLATFVGWLAVCAARAIHNLQSQGKPLNTGLRLDVAGTTSSAGYR